MSIYRYGQLIGPLDPEPPVGIMVREDDRDLQEGHYLIHREWTHLEDGYWYSQWSQDRATWEEVRARKVRFTTDTPQRHGPLGWNADGSRKTLADIISSGELPPPPAPKFASYVPTRTNGGKFKIHKTLAHAKAAVGTAQYTRRWPDAVIYEWDGQQWQVLYVSHPGLSKAPWA